MWGSRALAGRVRQCLRGLAGLPTGGQGLSARRGAGGLDPLRLGVLPLFLGLDQELVLNEQSAGAS